MKVTKVVSLFLETEILYWQESDVIPLGGSCSTSLKNLEISEIEIFDNISDDELIGSLGNKIGYDINKMKIMY